MMKTLVSTMLTGVLLLSTQFVQADVGMAGKFPTSIQRICEYPHSGLHVLGDYPNEEECLYDHGYGLASPCGCVVLPEPCLQPYPPEGRGWEDKTEELWKVYLGQAHLHQVY